MTLSPTALTLRRLRDDGWTTQVCEHWNPHARIREDLWGFVDIIALRHDVTLGVQATSYTNVSARVRKIADSPYVGAVRDAGWHLEVWGWRKIANRWVLARRVDVS